MSSVIWSVFGFIVAIGVLVTFHEFGHYWVARRCGVKVLRFSVGFGRPLWRRNLANGTELVLAAIPLGGYVKMLDERESEDPIPDELRDQAFNRKSLAQRSATAAKEIKGLIGRSTERVEAGERLVQEAGGIIGEIVGSVQRVTQIVAEISSASAEQSSGIEQVNIAVGQIEEVTQQNAALVEEASAAAHAMADQADALRRAVAIFKMEGVAASA